MEHSKASTAGGVLRVGNSKEDGEVNKIIREEFSRRSWQERESERPSRRFIAER
jgi:hypothetical protein